MLTVRDFPPRSDITDELWRKPPSSTAHLALEKLRQREGEKHPTIRKLSRNLKRPSPRGDEHAKDPRVDQNIVRPTSYKVLHSLTLRIADGKVRHLIKSRGLQRTGDCLRLAVGTGVQDAEGNRRVR